MKPVKTVNQEINAVHPHKHTKPSQNTQKAMNQKMEKQEYKDEYAKKSSVEGPFGIFKEQFQIEKK